MCCVAQNWIHGNEYPRHRADFKAVEKIDKELLAVIAKSFKTKSFLQRKNIESHKKRKVLNLELKQPERGQFLTCPLLSRNYT